MPRARSRLIAADREPETGSLVCARKLSVELHERLEDRADLVIGNPDSRIDDAYASDTVVEFAFDRNLASARRELDRVRKQIEKNLRFRIAEPLAAA